MALIALYLASAWTLGHIKVNNAHTDQGNIDIFLLSNGVHTDIAMPLHNDDFDWRTIVSPTDTRKVTPADYVALGWGDRGFYLETPTWADLTAYTALKAVSGLNRTAIHATFYPELQENQNSVRIRITSEEYRKLIQSILPSFQRQNGRARPIPNTGYKDNDIFYEANGHYSLFTTCNTWTNLHLKNSGLKSVVWTPFAGSLMDAYGK